MEIHRITIHPLQKKKGSQLELNCKNNITFGFLSWPENKDWNGPSWDFRLDKPSGKPLEVVSKEIKTTKIMQIIEMIKKMGLK